MGSGGKFIADKVPIAHTVTTYAAAGNLRDAVDKAEEAVTKISNGSTDPEDFKTLKVETERIKTRSMTLVAVLRNLIKSQEKS